MPDERPPTIEQLAEWARTRSFQDVEKEFGVEGMVRVSRRHGYPRSRYYRLEAPAASLRRRKAVDAFLASRRRSRA